MGRISNQVKEELYAKLCLVLEHHEKGLHVACLYANEDWHTGSRMHRMVMNTPWWIMPKISPEQWQKILALREHQRRNLDDE